MRPDGRIGVEGVELVEVRGARRVQPQPWGLVVAEIAHGHSMPRGSDTLTPAATARGSGAESAQVLLLGARLSCHLRGVPTDLRGSGRVEAVAEAPEWALPTHEGLEVDCRVRFIAVTGWALLQGGLVPLTVPVV